MKKIIFLLLISLVFTSCKEDKATKINTETSVENTNDGFTLLEGNFVYYEDAAVLQTPTSIFGVILNENTMQLAKEAKAFQKEATDMVKVRIKGLIEKKPEDTEGWDYNINIKKIISVEALNAKDNEVIKLEK
jgi:hypothetical protein